MANSKSLAGLLLMVATACQVDAEPSLDLGNEVAPRQVLGRMAGVFEVSVAPLGPRADAELATGLVYAPSSSVTPPSDPPVFPPPPGDTGPNGEPLEHRCAATLVAPDHVVTTAVCGGQIGSIRTLEMYAPAAWLNWLPSTVLTTTGAWFDFQSPTLTAADGYFVEQFSCEVVRSCPWFGPSCGGLAGESGLAVLRCDGNPGLTYGVVDIATSDNPNEAVAAIDANEVYDIDDQPGDGLWFDHYLGPGNSWTEFIQNFAGRHQPLPTHSVPRPLQTANQKVPEFVHWQFKATDVLSCKHHNPLAFQIDGYSGEYEFLGAMPFWIDKDIGVPGEPPESEQMCHHPALHTAPTGDPTSVYFKLEYGRAALADLPGCPILLDKGLPLNIGCVADAALNGLPTTPIDQLGNACPQCEVLESVMPRAEPWVSFAEGSTLTFPSTANPDVEHRFSAFAYIEPGEEQFVHILTPDGTMVAEFSGTTDVERQLVQLRGNFVPSGELSIVASEGVTVGNIAIVPADGYNGFDRFVDRQGVGLILPGETRAVVARMGGNGEGFSAVIHPEERLVLSREAIPDTSDLRIEGFLNRGEGLLRVGVITDDGESLDVDVDGFERSFETLLDVGDATPVAVFVELAEASGPVELDWIRITGA